VRRSMKVALSLEGTEETAALTSEEASLQTGGPRDKTRLLPAMHEKPKLLGEPPTRLAVSNGNKAHVCRKIHEIWADGMQAAQAIFAVSPPEACASTIFAPSQARKITSKQGNNHPNTVRDYLDTAMPLPQPRRFVVRHGD